MKCISDEDYLDILRFLQDAVGIIKEDNERIRQIVGDNKNLDLSDKRADEALMKMSNVKAATTLTDEQYWTVKDVVSLAMSYFKVELDEHLKLFDKDAFIIECDKRDYDQAVKAYEIMEEIR